MKRTAKLIAILGVLLLAAGCVFENRDNCPIDEPLNVSLEFLLPDENDGCKFDSNISAVDLHIYDGKENLVLAKYMTSERLQEYKGVKLTLPPGKYSVVAWGNVGDECIFHDTYDTDGPLNSTITYDPLGNRFGEYNSGKIFYAPRSGAFTRSSEMPGCHIMDVDPEMGYEGFLEFRPAHRIIKVYIEGYSGTPMVELIGLPVGLSWLGMGQVRDEDAGIIIVNSKNTTSYEKNGVAYDYAEFEAFHFDGSNNILLDVISPETLDVFYSVLLNDAIEEIYDPEQIEVSVLLKFTSAGVEISVPEWHREDVDPSISV